jgi:hypothetical protein
MSPTPVTLESIGVRNWSELYALDTAEILRRMDEKNVPLHPGDAFLAITVLRGVSDLQKATAALDRGTARLVHLTWALLALAVTSVILAVAALLFG